MFKGSGYSYLEQRFWIFTSSTLTSLTFTVSIYSMPPRRRRATASNAAGGSRFAGKRGTVCTLYMFTPRDLSQADTNPSSRTEAWRGHFPSITEAKQALGSEFKLSIGQTVSRKSVSVESTGETFNVLIQVGKVRHSNQSLRDAIHNAGPPGRRPTVLKQLKRWMRSNPTSVVNTMLASFDAEEGEDEVTDDGTVPTVEIKKDPSGLPIRVFCYGLDENDEYSGHNHSYVSIRSGDEEIPHLKLRMHQDGVALTDMCPDHAAWDSRYTQHLFSVLSTTEEMEKDQIESTTATLRRNIGALPKVFRRPPDWMLPMFDDVDPGVHDNDARE